MASYNKFNQFVADVANKVHNLGSDTLKVMLTNTAPIATNTVYANLVDLTTTGGYTAGGASVAITSSTQSSGLYKLLPTSPFTVTWTGSGSGFGPFRYAALYNSTTGSGNLISWYDYGSSISLNSGDTFTVTFDGTNGVLELT